MKDITLSTGEPVTVGGLIILIDIIRKRLGSDFSEYPENEINKRVDTRKNIANDRKVNAENWMAPVEEMERQGTGKL